MVTACSSAGALLVVTDGKIAFANEAAAGLLREGSSASDWVGCPDPRHADGSGPLVFESSPFAAAHGTPSELVSVRTLTRGPEVQEEALAALDRFRAAIDLAADAIVLIDYDTHRYLDVNATACRMFGYSREEMLSLGPQRVNSRLREDERRRAFARLLELPGQHEVMETVHTRSDGAQFHAEVSRRAVQAGGRWVVIAAIRDISFRKKTESELHRHLLELQRSNDELERFAYVASHDLSEPLRMIASYMALLRRRYSPLLDDDGREFIAYAVDGAERMKRLIDDLLLYSRTGRTANPPQALSLESLMGDVTRNLERLIEEKGATVEIARCPRSWATARC